MAAYANGGDHKGCLSLDMGGVFYGTFAGFIFFLIFCSATCDLIGAELSKHGA